MGDGDSTVGSIQGPKGENTGEVRAEVTQFSSRVTQGTLAGHRKAFNSGFWKCHFSFLPVQPPDQEATLLSFLDNPRTTQKLPPDTVVPKPES